MAEVQQPGTGFLWRTDSYAVAKPKREVEVDEWLSMRVNYAIFVLQDCVEIDRRKRGGTPVLKGTRFTLSQVLAEIADDRRLTEIADSFDLELRFLEGFLRGLSICLDRPAVT